MCDAALEAFFAEEIEKKEFAKILRRLQNVVVDFVLKDENNEFRREWVSDGLFWINYFAETIDPCLEDEEDSSTN